MEFSYWPECAPFSVTGLACPQVSRGRQPSLSGWVRGFSAHSGRAKTAGRRSSRLVLRALHSPKVGEWGAAPRPVPPLGGCERPWRASAPQGGSGGWARERIRPKAAKTPMQNTHAHALHTRIYTYQHAHLHLCLYLCVYVHNLRFGFAKIRRHAFIRALQQCAIHNAPGLK